MAACVKAILAISKTKGDIVDNSVLITVIICGTLILMTLIDKFVPGNKKKLEILRNNK